MVNLPSPEEQHALDVAERRRQRLESFQGPRNHHLWGARFGTSRHEAKARQSPATLTTAQLEDMATSTVMLTQRTVPNSKPVYQKAMKLLRQHYNLNFAIVGDDCPGGFYPGELDAPER